MVTQIDTKTMSDKVKTLKDFLKEVLAENDIPFEAYTHTSIGTFQKKAIERYAAYERKQGFDQGVDFASDYISDPAEYYQMMQDKESFKP